MYSSSTVYRLYLFQNRQPHTPSSRTWFRTPPRTSVCIIIERRVCITFDSNKKLRGRLGGKTLVKVQHWTLGKKQEEEEERKKKKKKKHDPTQITIQSHLRQSSRRLDVDRDGGEEPLGCVEEKPRGEDDNKANNGAVNATQDAAAAAAAAATGGGGGDGGFAACGERCRGDHDRSAGWVHCAAGAHESDGECQEDAADHPDVEIEMLLFTRTTHSHLDELRSPLAGQPHSTHSAYIGLEEDDGGDGGDQSADQNGVEANRLRGGQGKDQSTECRRSSHDAGEVTLDSGPV